MKRILAGVAALGLLAGIALAQVPGLFIASPTGLEQINVLVPSTGTVVTNPQIQTVTVNQIRNATGILVIPAGTTVNTVLTTATAKLVSSGAITTWNITLPASPFDGETVEVACPGGTATVAVSAAAVPAGTTIVGTAFTACTSGGAAANTGEYIYSIANNNWYRIQ
jgi:hypothetical protein